MHVYLIALKSILKKEINRFLRIWIQTLLPPVITMTLYFIIFGDLMGSRIGNINDISYIEFIAPGLIMMTVMTNAYANVSSSFFSAKFQHSIEELLVAPVPEHIILTGYIGGGVVRSIFVGCLVIVVSLFFVPFHIHSLSVLIFILLLTAILFSLAGLLNAVFACTYDDISLIPTFILTPLIYLGGIFYSLPSLTPFWQNISKFNPIMYMISAFRYGFFGIHDVSIPFTFLVLVSLILILYFLVWFLIKNGYKLKS